ncbi:hypothetical protein ACIA49_13305 [Kribbella sp. NPDC051587]|uniref:hypothetical protein n=1 Tax=Kribbella sp. NPDC051587 TaxID=3364119 RepID=UPI0037B795A7
MNNAQGPGEPAGGDPQWRESDGAQLPVPRGDNPLGQAPNQQPAVPWGAGEPTSATGVPGGAGLLAAEVLSMVLWAGASFLIVFWLTQTFDWPSWGLIAGWLLTGLVVIWPGSDGLLAKYLLGLRRPTMVEGQRLAPSWYAVANRAGIDPNSYTVWVQNSEAVTGFASGGNTVSVTRWALYTLPPTHLEAALAHDLQMHARGSSWFGRLMHWYSIPARLVGLVIRLLLKLSRTIPAVGCTLIGFLLVAYLGIFLAALVFYDSLSVPFLFLLPLFSPLLFLGAGKLMERLADRATVDLGLGRKLLEVFYGWQAQHEGGHRRGGLQPDWLAGQPSIAERIRSVEVYLQRP